MLRQITLLSFVAFLCFSCTSGTSDTEKEAADFIPLKVTRSELGNRIDSMNLLGAVLLFDQAKNTYYSNDFEWAGSGFLPASTFKIANSIQALENGVVENDSTMFYWDRQPRRTIWEKDMTLKEAFKVSCVPCYQQIARETGVKRMRETLDKIGYPGMVFDSTTLESFWLQGNSRITQFQQIDFLKRLVNKELPINPNTYEILSKIMFIEKKEGYDLYGKTGWVQPNDSTNIGWFVGYAITPKDTLYVATNIQPGQNFDMDNFIKARLELAQSSLKSLIH